MMRKVMKIEAGGDRLISSLKLRIAAYCRVSTDNDDQLLSLEAQKQHYEKIIRDNPEWEFAGLYCDEGISGTKKENREGLLRLLRDCEKHKIDFIITKSISRFARNTADCLEIVRRLSELGVSIYFEKENINTRAMDSELLLSVLSSLAENESVSISQNNKWGVRKRFQNGTYRQAIAPYGYDKIGATLVPNPEEAPVIKRIFDQALSGVGVYKIAKGLNADGIAGRNGKPWSAGTVRGILANERYIGDLLLQKTYTDDSFRRRKNGGELDMYYMKDHHEPLVSREDFEAAKRMLDQHAKEKGIVRDGRKYNARYPFSGRIVCGQCGGTFKRRIHQAGRQSEYVSWCCGTHIEDISACSMMFVREEHIRKAFVNMTNRLHSGLDMVLKPLIEALRRQDGDGYFARLDEIERLISENSERAQVLAGLMAKGYLEPALFNSQANALKQEAERLKKEKAALSAAISEFSAVSAAEEVYRCLLRRGYMEEFDSDFFERFVDGMTVFSPVEIGFRLKCGLVLRERMER